jgi:hypothetical protein
MSKTRTESDEPAQTGPSATEASPVLSARLQTLAVEIMAGRAPNAGRFCGRCYNPLSPDERTCSRCETAISTRAPVEQIPREVIDMVRAKRRREALVVRSIAYGGFGAALALALVLLALLPPWWGIAAFFLVIAAGYIAAANVANSMGDGIGYRWGQRTLERRWREFVERRGF